MPAFFEESCVIRILSRDQHLLSLSALGFYEKDISIFKKQIAYSFQNKIESFS